MTLEKSALNDFVKNFYKSWIRYENFEVVKEVISVAGACLKAPISKLSSFWIKAVEYESLFTICMKKCLNPVFKA